MSNLYIVWLQNFSDCFRERRAQWQCDKDAVKSKQHGIRKYAKKLTLRVWKILFKFADGFDPEIPLVSYF